MLAVQIPRSKLVNRKKQKPHLTPEEFERLINLVSEPYATMIYVAIFAGLRVSELAGLQWNDVHLRELEDGMAKQELATLVRLTSDFAVAIGERRKVRPAMRR